jgi:hypothetical protein
MGNAKTDSRHLWLLLGVTFLSRLPFRSSIPYGLDSIQFVLALEQYDVRLHQPHPPGYFLFVALGKLFQFFFQDPNFSYVVLNFIASLLTVWITVRLGSSLFGSTNGLLAGWILAFSPVFWFHGEVALSNALDAFFVCLVAFLSWKNLGGDFSSLYGSALALGLAGGVRQNTLVFLLPLWLVSLRQAGWKKAFQAMVCLALVVLGWYLPMSWLSGGVSGYQQALRDHWFNANWHGIGFSWITFHFQCIYSFVLWGLGPGLFLLLLALGVQLFEGEQRKCFFSRQALFLALWITPSLLFFLLVMSHPFQSGHSLIYLPALAILLGAALTRLEDFWETKFRPGSARFPKGAEPEKRRYPHFKLALAGVLLLFNLGIFLTGDTPVSLKALRVYETKIDSLVRTVPLMANPEEVILVNLDLMQFGYRDFMYHLPQFHTYQLKMYSLEGKPRLFAGKDRHTEILERAMIPARVKYFLLPADIIPDKLQPAQGGRLNALPAGKIIELGNGLRLFQGDARQLPRLFPTVPIEFSP